MARLDDVLGQVIRRACAVDGLGVRASIRRGLATVKGNLKESLVVWLMWLVVRPTEITTSHAPLMGEEGR